MTTTARPARRFRCTRCSQRFVSRDGALGHVARVHPAFAGLIERRVARATGATYSIYDTFAAGFESDTDDRDLAFTVCCETHSRLVFVRTLTSARSHLPTGAWCGVCMGTEQAEYEASEEATAL